MLHIELLSVGDFLQHYSFIDVSFIATTYKNNEMLKFDPFFIKNTLEMDVKNISESPCKLVEFYKCKINVINNISSLPFNSRLILLEVYSDNHVNVNCSRITQINNNECKKYSNNKLHVFLWKYGKKGNVEQVFKYMLMPYLLTILLQLTHRIKGEYDIANMGNWISVASSFLLTDVALFFTVPTTNVITCIEKYLFLSFGFKIFITLFAFYNLDILLGVHIFSHHVFDIVMSIIISVIFIVYSYFLFSKSSLETSSVIVQHMNNIH